LKTWLRALALIALAGLATLAVALGWLKMHEDQLVFEAARSRTQRDGPLPAGAEPIGLPEAAGGLLPGILMRAAAAHDTGYWVLHLHGNADSAFSAGQLRHCAALRALGLNVLSFDYRGFGPSPGVPSEAHVEEDAEAAYHALLRRGVPADHLILWGHSLGTGPAVYLASRHRAAALVLFGAFTSIPDVAADQYPLLPVRGLVGIHFDSLARIAMVHMPVIIAHSRFDRVIPLSHAERLYAAARAPKWLLVLDDPPTDGLGGHVDALYDHLDALTPELRALTGAAIGR